MKHPGPSRLLRRVVRGGPHQGHDPALDDHEVVRRVAGTERLVADLDLLRPAVRAQAGELRAGEGRVEDRVAADALQLAGHLRRRAGGRLADDG
jgi:hypothetical protein